LDPAEVLAEPRGPDRAEHERDREDREADPHEAMREAVERFERRAAILERGGVEPLALERAILDEIDRGERAREREDADAERRERDVDPAEHRQILGAIAAGVSRASNSN